MNITKIFVLLHLLVLSLLATGCRRGADTVWDDTRSAGRHMSRGIRTLGGKHGDSRQIRSRNEFMGDYDYQEVGPNDFIPMEDQCIDEVSMAEMTHRPPRESPGEYGSSIPGIEAFQDPSTNPRLSGVFRNVYFAFNSSLVKGQESLDTIHNVSDYMRRNPNTYVFVEGHCDERGPEAYNLSLGSYRANSVRNLLINEGVSADNIFTISYGKERPLIVGHDEESWYQNRRAEFKVYQR